MGQQKRRKLFVATQADQREAIASPIRMQLMEKLCTIGPVTVGDLAQEMSRSPQSLYHHMKQLLGAKLIHQVGTQQSGARQQAIYDSVADLIEIPSGLGDPELDAIDCRAVGALFRQTEREFEAALKSHPKQIHAGKYPVVRLNAQLSKKAHREVLKHLKAVQKIVADEIEHAKSSRAQTQNCSFTYALLPIAPKSSSR